MFARLLSRSRACILALAAAALIGGCASTTVAPDPIAGAMRQVPMKEAHDTAASRGRLLLVLGTADWCGPCQRMLADTWTDPRIRRWVARNAMVYYLDVDDERPLSDELDIHFMPQVIAYRNGEEIDRANGYHGVKEFANWLNTLGGERIALQ